jgi:methionyl-tRNA formyltransferase
LTRTPQREGDATYCRPLTKEDTRLHFDAPAESVVNHVRSLSPKPGAWMQVDGKRLKVLQAEVVGRDAGTNADGTHGAAPGTVLVIDSHGPIVACADGGIRLVRVIPEGKAVMSGAQFAQTR